MNYLSCIAVYAADAFLAQFPEAAHDLDALSPMLGQLLAQHGPAARVRFEKDRRSLSGLRFSFLTLRHRDGEGGEAIALAMGLALTSLLYPGFSALVQRHTGAPPCFALAWRLACGREVWDASDTSLRALARVRLFLPGMPSASSLTAPLLADERLAGYVAGGDAPDALLTQVAAFAPAGAPPALFARGELVPPLRTALEHAVERGDLVQLTGASGCGKRLLLRSAAHALSLPLLEVDCRLLLMNPLETVWTMVDSVRREALFYGAGVCFYHADAAAHRARPEGDDDAWETRFLHLCAQPLMDSGLPVCVCSDIPAYFLAYAGCCVHKFTLPDYTRTEQIALWEGFAALYGVTLDGMRCGSKYSLTPAQIQTAVRQLANDAPCPDDRQIARVCSELLPPPAQGSIRRVSVRVNLDDLKLPEEQKQKLRDLCTHVLYRHKVYDDWNMEARFPYGKSVSALLVGPPGTGKTMAVHVLANLLDIPLYQINLSQVVDKYIGETEKRLEEIFNTAEKNNSILFFDEADSIFGKRSEVNDAKDKYANTEVSYILQRIEQYDGIVVLATNYKKNIDEAFMRRMRYLIEFMLPSEALRGEIWRGAFAAEVPLESVDFGYLARQFELSGGSIKNVALNAAFLAAGEGVPVNMKHILRCIRSENAKMGKPMLKQDFAEYGALFE